MNSEDGPVEQISPGHERRSLGTPQPNTPANGMLRLVLVIAFLFFAAWIIVSGIMKRTRATIAVANETREMAVPVVSVVQPRRASPAQEIVLPANIQPWTDAPIYARTNGYLKRWYVDIGARVKEGQLLAEIDTPEVNQQLAQARADLATAKANYRLAEITATRYQDLLKTDSVSKQETDNAIGDFQAKAAMVESAQFNVNRLQELQSFQKIYAPFTGVITARKTDVGALVNSGNGGPAQELFHIASTHTMRVYASVPQINSRGAKPGLSAELTLAEFPGRRFKGTLARTAESIDAASRTLLTEFEVKNPTGELLPGAFAEIHLKIPNESASYQLPVNALIFRSAGLQVATVRGDNRVALIPVTLGRDFGTEVEVASGLSGDETVIVNPPDSLVENAEVKIAKPADAGGSAK